MAAKNDNEKKKEVQEYQKLANKIKPPRPILRNVTVAFLVGGLICLLAQIILNIFQGQGMTDREASGMTTVVMIIIGAILTALGIYDELGKFAGAGSAIPVTGFANSMVSPAIEFKREGYVLGLGAKMFAVAGPVIVYGSIAAIIMAFLHALIK